MKLSYESRWVRRMLADFGMALREPVDCGFYLYPRLRRFASISKRTH